MRLISEPLIDQYHALELYYFYWETDPTSLFIPLKHVNSEGWVNWVIPGSNLLPPRVIMVILGCLPIVWSSPSPYWPYGPRSVLDWWASCHGHLSNNGSVRRRLVSSLTGRIDSETWQMSGLRQRSDSVLISGLIKWPSPRHWAG